MPCARCASNRESANAASIAMTDQQDRLNAVALAIQDAWENDDGNWLCIAQAALDAAYGVRHRVGETPCPQCGFTITHKKAEPFVYHDDEDDCRECGGGPCRRRPRHGEGCL